MSGLVMQPKKTKTIWLDNHHTEKKVRGVTFLKADEGYRYLGIQNGSGTMPESN